MSKYKKMKQLIADMRLPEYRYKQLLDAVFLQGIMRFEDMKLLPKTLREKLVEQFGETVVEIKAIHHEKSMQTDKVLFELSDGNRVETVGLFYKEGWNSFCISSQSGCGFGCKFCATGTLGLRRNLTVDEITDQILYFMQQGCSINSISFMGMGEPFANPQVFEALHDLTAPELFGLSQRRITISTIGIVPGIQKLTREYPQVNLAYSLHAPTDRLRVEMSRNVQSGNTQNLKSMVIQRSFPKWSVAERRKTAAASDQAAVCACAHSRYFAGGSPSGLRV